MNHRKLAELPQAREILLPELLAGCAGAPLEWARDFHRFFFDVAQLAIGAHGLLVLQDVVIGRPRPVLREIQLWGATIDADDLLRVASTDIARQVGIAPEVQAVICTGGVLFIRSVAVAPCIDDLDLRHSITASLVIATTVMLADLAPYVRIGEGVVWAYRALPERAAVKHFGSVVLPRAMTYGFWLMPSGESRRLILRMYIAPSPNATALSNEPSACIV